MKKIMCITAFYALLALSASSQTSVSRMYIKGGNDALPNYLKEVFMYPSFEEGIVEYNNGKRYKSKLNYNRALGAIQFISESGDTLALSDESTISTVSIGEELFFMNPVCMHKIAGNEKVMLVENEKIRLADKQKVGAFGIPNDAGTIDSYDRSYSRNNHYLDINEQLLIRKTSLYFISKDGKEFVAASKKNVLSMFPDAQNDIKKFIDDKHIEFNDEAGLITLTNYLSTL